MDTQIQIWTQLPERGSRGSEKRKGERKRDEQIQRKEKDQVQRESTFDAVAATVHDRKRKKERKNGYATSYRTSERDRVERKNRRRRLKKEKGSRKRRHRRNTHLFFLPRVENAKEERHIEIKKKKRGCRGKSETIRRACGVEEEDRQQKGEKKRGDCCCCDRGITFAPLTRKTFRLNLVLDSVRLSSSHRCLAARCSHFTLGYGCKTKKIPYTLQALPNHWTNAEPPPLRIVYLTPFGSYQHK